MDVAGERCEPLVDTGGSSTHASMLYSSVSRCWASSDAMRWLGGSGLVTSGTNQCEPGRSLRSTRDRPWPGDAAAAASRVVHVYACRVHVCVTVRSTVRVKHTGVRCERKK